MKDVCKKVLIVDDREEYVGFFKKILEKDGKIEVTSASKLFPILRKAVLGFDVILLNIEMKEISGLDILYQIVQRTETPVIVITGDSDFSSEETLTAMGYGAVDFWQIDDNLKSLMGHEDKILSLIKSGSMIKPKNNIFKKSYETKKAPKLSDKFVVLGSSTGGPSVVRSILMSFPKDFPSPVFVVQHMTKIFTRIFAKKLKRYCDIEVKEAEHLEEVRKGVVYLVPGDYNLEVSKQEDKFIITLNKKKVLIMPSIDLALSSIAKACGENVVLAILTGIGRDGSLGAAQVKKCGGKVIAQDKDSSVVFGMPRVVIEEGNADFVLSGNLIGKKIIELL